MLYDLNELETEFLDKVIRLCNAYNASFSETIEKICSTFLQFSLLTNVTEYGGNDENE